MTTSARLLRLLSLLQARRDWTGPELATRLEVSPRTIRRDVERLRELGYPVAALTGPAGGYRLNAGAAMPPLLLDDEEAVAIAIGLRTAAGSAVEGLQETSVRALVKLEQVLPSHLRRRVGALQFATATLPDRGPGVDPELLTLIAGACRDGETLRFEYRTRAGDEMRRRVEPHNLVKVGRRWYLLAWCCDREDWRVFRVDRVSRPFPAGRRFERREVPGGDPAEYVASNISAAPYRYRARVTLHAPAEEIRRRFPPAASAVTPIDDARCEYRSSDDSLEWLAMRVGMFGVDFDVHDPPELADEFRRLAHRYERAAG